MSKKPNKMNWKRNLRLSDDKSFLNTGHWFVPDDFVGDFLHPGYIELCCDYLNKLRIEYVTLRNNGQPKSSYKAEVAAKINDRKEGRLKRKLHKAKWFMIINGLKLKPTVNLDEETPKPRFEYEFYDAQGWSDNWSPFADEANEVKTDEGNDG